MHVHVEVKGISAIQLRNIVNITARNEDMLCEVLRVDPDRVVRWCHKTEVGFAEVINDIPKIRKNFGNKTLLFQISPKSCTFVAIPKKGCGKMMNKINSVCVYCASSTKIDSVYFDAARELGTLLGQRQIRLINGAGNMGLMSAVSDAALRAGGEVTGVIPRFMVEQGWHHTGLTQLVEVESMHQRKKTMADLSDAVIALPGGCGTLEELLEIITWKQLGLYLNPIVILNVKNYFDPLLDMLRQAVDENFMRVQHGAIWHVAQTPQEAVELIYTTPLWDASIRKFAAI